MDKIIIRKASLKDLEILLRFEQAIIAAERPFDITLKKQNTRYYDLAKMITAPHIEIVVAELDNKLIASGYARIESSKPYLQHDNHAYLGFMYVDPMHRGQGINKKIIEFLKKWVNAQKITELRLDVYVDNISAIKAYEKNGFSKHMVQMRMSIKK